LLQLGLSSARVRWLVDSGRFRTLFPGVYAGFTGPVPALTRVWAAVLYAGPTAAAAGRTALWLHDAVPAGIIVGVPQERRVRCQPGLTVLRRRQWDRLVQFAPGPPRLRLPEAVLDVADTLSDPELIGLVIRVVQRRLTSADRLQQALLTRARHRRQQLLFDLLDQVRAGLESPLERRYHLRVECPHGLPSGLFNHSGAGRRRDVRYEPFAVVVELDGAASHLPQNRSRDYARDRSAVLNGDAVLVYGWADVATEPCRVAGEVAAVLTRRGWTGRLRPCGPGCPCGPP
jgi:hypothetical protein